MLLTSAAQGVTPNYPSVQYNDLAVDHEKQKQIQQRIDAIQQEASKALPAELQKSLEKNKKRGQPEEKKRKYTKALKKWSDSKFESGKQRAKDYIDENTSQFILSVPVLVGGSVIGGAGVGAGVGAAVGLAIAGPPGIPPGAIIGAGTGALAALIVTAPISIVITKNDFIRWKRHGRAEDLLPVLRKMYEHHESLCFTCPLTASLFENPVMIPTGVTYEKEAIMEELEKHNGSVDDYCKSQIVITKNNLYTDYAMMGSILAALERLAQEDLKRLPLDSDIKLGLNSSLNELNRHIKLCESLGRKLITGLWDKKIIKANFYRTYNERLNELIRD
jgi:U-box domain-containing protein